jgi:murein DD-endopeptidase MepM/ murein hydrolase activator NlpD
MSTPGKVRLTTLALIVWSVSASPPLRAADMGPVPTDEAATLAAAQVHRDAEVERAVAIAPTEGLVAQGGGPAGRSGTCMQERERRAIDEAIERYRQLHDSSAAATAAAAPPKYPFYPMGGRLYHDLFSVMFVDLDPTSPGILDWDCTDYTYDGHRGVDVMLRTFTEQEIGVPIFAALDGVVVDSHDGEDDHHTEPIGQQVGNPNYVVIDHGSERFCSYLHMRLGSVMVSPGQPVKAGQQIGFTASSGHSSVPHLHFETHLFGPAVEPYTGACNQGESQWVEQTPIRRDTYLWDMIITDVDIGAFPPLPFDIPRTGTFVQGVRPVYFLFRTINKPANSNYRARFQRPDSSIALDSGTQGFGNQFLEQEWWFWNGFNVNLNVTGTWHILLDINGNAIAAAPFDVVSSAGQIVNRAPYPITVSLDPPVPAVADTIFCLVNTDLVLDDPDYDVVRYHYVWRVNGQIVRDLVSAGQADAIPHHTASPGSLLECTVTPSDGQDDGPTVSVSAALDAVSKFSQPPDGSGEAIASNLDWTDLSPNVVVADDFVSDGRPVTGVRWWGSALGSPSPDGWLISFHEPLTAGGSAELALGLYFCDPAIVTSIATTLTACDTRPVVEYEVSLEDCCLIHASDDSRNQLRPAQTDAFHEQVCFHYGIDIQALVGHKFVGAGATCTEASTGNTATSPFWGWHTTGVESGTHAAWQSAVSMPGADWLYGPWTPASPTCSAPNMAFQLLTDQNPTYGDCNHNGTPDACESGPDCQPNGVLDECDVALGTSKDCDGDGIPDECEYPSDPDCNANGVLDACDSQSVAGLSGTFSAVLGFVDISVTGVPLNLTDDGTANVTMPFVSAAFDTPKVVVSNNGGIGFGPALILTGPNRSLPSVPPSQAPFEGNEALLAYWDDLDATTGNVYYATTGTTPSRTFIVEWKDRPEYPGDALLNGNEGTFEIQIFETPVGGVVAQYLYADTNFLDASFNDGRSATVGYQRNATSVIQWSFNTAGAVTSGKVISLLHGDLNGNGRPDVCDPAAPLRTGSADMTRFLGGLSVLAPGPTALRVRMVDLQNPAPPNPPQFPPQNFGCWEVGAACGTVLPAVPPVAACVGTGESVPPTPGPTPPSGQGGCARWVGQPSTFYESQGPPLAGPFRAARLQCTPLYRDWTLDGVFYVTGGEIAPSSKYDVQSFAASCAGMEGSCLDSSPPLRVTTARSADIATRFNPPDPSTQPDALDLTSVVNKVKGVTGAPPKVQMQLQPNLPELNGDVNALDVAFCVDAIKGKAYSFSGPCPCPSTVTCNLTSCTSPAPCGGGMCVKTCTGGGPNDDQPCINNSHCPGGACGSGFCRDACGRCSPP